MKKTLAAGMLLFLTLVLFFGLCQVQAPAAPVQNVILAQSG